MKIKIINKSKEGVTIKTPKGLVKLSWKDFNAKYVIVDNFYVEPNEETKKKFKEVEELSVQAYVVQKSINASKAAGGAGSSDDFIRLYSITEKIQKLMDFPNMIYAMNHLKEQFEELKILYPGVELIENPYYETCNNISSLYAVRDHLEDCMILDGDQIIYDPSILAPEFERSGYNAVWTDEETTEWLMTVENGIVTGCSRTGGSRGWQLYSISRWSAEDGAKLKKHLELEFDVKKNRQIYWDDVAMFCHPEEYTLGIRPMRAEDIIEIDSLEELIAADPTYAGI